MHNHGNREAGFRNLVKDFPPFVIERCGMAPCSQGDRCTEGFCHGWYLASDPYDVLTEKDWEAWLRAVETNSW